MDDEDHSLIGLSFLNEQKNTDLIRWSDDGNSFIVLDEDEFARKLIPELFKHNNYASFVRQLNMYGFHKKVGLSDNSMRASERKNKSPSEYSNPYFRRGHAELLWLIQKPKNVTSQGGKVKGRAKIENDQNDDDNEDDLIEEIPGNGHATDGRPKSRPQLAIGQGDSALPQSQLTSIRQELQTIRSQQQLISKMIAQIKREHEHLYGQAANFQEQHSRHENSINAILSFLASFYNNRNLQNNDVPQSLANAFAGSIPHEQASANVVDVGDFSFDDTPEQRPFKKQQLLLNAPPKSGHGQQLPGAASMSPQSNRSQARRLSQSFRSGQYQPGNVEEVFDSEPPSNRPSPNNETAPTPQPSAIRTPQSDILSMIQNTNARRSSASTQANELPAALTSLQNSTGNTLLTPAQRDDMLRLMNDSSNTGLNTPNSALVSPSTPPTSKSYNVGLADTKAEIDRLADMQAEQDRSVQNLANLLQPLSPTGTIPGIGDGSNVPPPALDLDQIFNSGDYFNDFPADGSTDFSGLNDEPDIGNQDTTGNNSLNFHDVTHNGDELFGDIDVQPTHFGYDNVNDGDEKSTVYGKVESMPSSGAPSPANTAGSEGFKRDRQDSYGTQSPAKRRKKDV